ncbi:hypothetical protein ACFXTN_033639 [Malus domestica]
MLITNHKSQIIHQTGPAPHRIPDPTHVSALQGPPNAFENRRRASRVLTRQVLVWGNNLRVIAIQAVVHVVQRVHGVDRRTCSSRARSWELTWQCGAHLGSHAVVPAELVHDPRRRHRFTGIVNANDSPPTLSSSLGIRWPLRT